MGVSIPTSAVSTPDITGGRSAPATACATAWNRLDVSDATEVNTAQRGAGYVLGVETFTAVSAASHGDLDSGLDAWTAFKSIGAPPSAATSLEARLVIPSALAANGTGGSVKLCLVASPTATLTLNDGYYAAVMLTSGDVESGRTVVRLGSGGSQNHGPMTTAPFVGSLTIGIDRTPEAVGAVVAYSDANTRSTSVSVINNDLITTPLEDFFLGVAASSLLAVPLATYAWPSGCYIEWRWVDPA